MSLWSTRESTCIYRSTKVTNWDTVCISRKNDCLWPKVWQKKEKLKYFGTCLFIVCILFSFKKRQVKTWQVWHRGNGDLGISLLQLTHGVSWCLIRPFVLLSVEQTLIRHLTSWNLTHNVLCFLWWQSEKSSQCFKDHRHVRPRPVRMMSLVS